ncbi:hypothetical protein DFP72DRAFT_922451 [Ephemerocybe angulata]|uniref:Uncharacterized protein n=1 Tax=Ephemerocybe angulata TaxID=980116 RepID=A0A8H6LWL8_9AGAR|nr:hypothetical protein DFP72DRAFT_922451 [Tulosesus angulatus]
MLFYEVLAFLLAAFRAWRTVRDDMKLWNNKRLSLSYVIFSQGLIYISAVLALSVITLFLNFRVKFFLSRMFSSLKLPLSGFLTARFLIQLRKWERRKTHVDSLNTLPTVDIVATSTRIDFNHPGGSDPSHLRSDPSVIRELGRDIGPRPTSLDMMDPLVDGDSDSFEIRQSDDTDRVPRNSSSLSLPQEERVEAAASVEQSPVSALFSASGNMNRRNRGKAPTIAENSGERGRSTLSQNGDSSPRISIISTPSSRKAHRAD